MKENRDKRLRGMAIGIIIGIVWGIAMDNIAIGLGMGVAFGAFLARSLSGGELIKDKKTRRRMSWSLISVSVLGCLLFGYVIGDLILGLAAGIGLSFVLGLKLEKMYDERMSSMFSKAARNAFVTVNAGLSVVLMFSQGLETPILTLPLGVLLKYVIYLSWGVFLLSWLYHANYKGE